MKRALQIRELKTSEELRRPSHACDFITDILDDLATLPMTTPGYGTILRERAAVCSTTFMFYYSRGESGVSRRLRDMAVDTHSITPFVNRETGDIASVESARNVAQCGRQSLPSNNEESRTQDASAAWLGCAARQARGGGAQRAVTWRLAAEESAWGAATGPCGSSAPQGTRRRPERGSVGEYRPTTRRPLGHVAAGGSLREKATGGFALLEVLPAPGLHGQLQRVGRFGESGQRWGGQGRRSDCTLKASDPTTGSSNTHLE
eukprot:jgi/Tetstr1/457678/TSEL_044225.t1